MMTNAVNWFFRQSGDMNPALVTGQIASLPWDRPDAENDGVIFVDPDGDRRGVTVTNRRVSVGPASRTGVYGLFRQSTLAVQTDASSEETETALSPIELQRDQKASGELLAINLCDENESDLQIPELEASIVGQPPASGAPPWFYLALIAIGLVLGEWALFNRRVVA
jgi:hypothetical protein